MGHQLQAMITRTNEQAYAALRPKKESGFVSRFLPLVGLTGLQPKRRYPGDPLYHGQDALDRGHPGRSLQ